MRKRLLVRPLSASVLPCYVIPDQVGDDGVVIWSGMTFCPSSGLILFVMPGFDRASLLLQRLCRVGAHEAEGLDGHSQYGCEQDCC